MKDDIAEELNGIDLPFERFASRRSATSSDVVPAAAPSGAAFDEAAWPMAAVLGSLELVGLCA